MKIETERTNRLKNVLRKLLDGKPESRLVKNKYRSIRAVLTEEYPGTLQIIPKDKLEEIIKSILYVDRMLRKETEGEEVEEKKILSQEFQIELGYEPLTELKNI